MEISPEKPSLSQIYQKVGKAKGLLKCYNSVLNCAFLFNNNLVEHHEIISFEEYVAMSLNTVLILVLHSSVLYG